MRCRVCSKVIPDASRYCAYCGAGTRPVGRGWPFWAVALLALATLGGGWLVGGLRPEPTPQIVEKVVTQIVLATPGPSPTPRPPTAMPPRPMPTLPPGTAQVSPIDSMTLLYVPAGEFTMGSADGDSDEKPQHKVTLDAFWIDRTEVTKDQYQKCVAAGKCAAPSCSGTGQGNHPVVCVSWQDAANYCAWAGRRLPTEAEWEKAARGADGRKYPWGDDAPTDRRLNYNMNVKDTTPVGSYPAGASPYGALDMAGNVWEWAADWYNAYSSAPAQNPQGPTSGSARVLRGGSWSCDQGYVRAAVRGWGYPESRVGYLGFRCARSP